MTAPETNALACAPRNALATAMGVALISPACVPADDPAPAPSATAVIDLAVAARFLTLLDEAAEGFTFQAFGEGARKGVAALASMRADDCALWVRVLATRLCAKSLKNWWAVQGSNL